MYTKKQDTTKYNMLNNGHVYIDIDGYIVDDVREYIFLKRLEQLKKSWIKIMERGSYNGLLTSISLMCLFN